MVPQLNLDGDNVILAISAEALQNATNAKSLNGAMEAAGIPVSASNVKTADNEQGPNIPEKVAKEAVDAAVEGVGQNQNIEVPRYAAGKQVHSGGVSV